MLLASPKLQFWIDIFLDPQFCDPEIMMLENISGEMFRQIVIILNCGNFFPSLPENFPQQCLQIQEYFLLKMPVYAYLCGNLNSV